MKGFYNQLAIWQFMKQKGLNDAHLDTGLLALTATGVAGRTYLALQTPVAQACEIWAIAFTEWHGMDIPLQAASTGVAAICEGYFALTYTQPQPPALNNTTDAVTQGNLEFRNVPLTISHNDVVDIEQPATQGAQVFHNKPGKQDFLTFSQPLRLALSQLEIYDNIQVVSGGATIHTEFSVDVFYKFVSISDAEYNALVALSSGQAVLSEVIVA